MNTAQASPRPAQTPARKVTCRYRRRNGEMCAGEVLDPDAEILLCAKHLGRAAHLFARMASRRC